MEVSKLYIMEDLWGLLSQIASCLWELDDDKRPTNKIQNESKYHLLACLRYLGTVLPVEKPFLQDLVDKIKVRIF